MVAVADRVIVELEAKLDKYNANVRAAEARFTAATRSITKDTKNVERQMAASTGAIGSQLRGLAGTFAAAFTVQQVARLADGYTRFTNQLKVAGLEGARLGDVQNDLFGVAQRYGVELESLGTLYGRSAQAGKELGASQAELLQFTEGVAAALKIQGGTAAEAKGALMQLGQALGSGIVRAEEFNSVQEGARPILAAVAKNLDAAGGSVSRLKVLVNDGKITSEEFFRAFLAGTAELQAQAENAGLTIAASFTILNNALGKYIGETDSSLSATERFSQAIISLSENLDTVVKALGVLGAILVGRYVAGLVAASTATGVLGTAIFAMQARAIGAATTMEALSLAGKRAGAAMLAAFGGPVGLAVAALAVGIYYLSTRTNEAEQASTTYAAAQAQLHDMQERTRGATDALATATGKARAEAVANAKALQQETIQYIANAKAALAAARAKAAVKLNEAKEAAVQTQADFGEMGGGRISPNRRKFNAKRQEAIQAATDARVAQQNLTNAEKTLAEITKALEAPPAIRTPTPTKVAKPKKAPKAKAGPDLDEIARRFQDDLENGELAYDRAMAEAAGTVQARVAVQKKAIRVEEAQQARAIAADDDLSKAQKADLLAINKRVADAQIAAIDAEEARALEADKYELLLADNQLASDLLEGQRDRAKTREESLAIELRLLDLQKEAERIQLQQIEADTTLRDATREAARRRLAQLDTLYADKAQTAKDSHKSPGERYLEGFDAESLNDQLESIAVDGLKGIEDQLTTTIAKVFELGGAFGNVANQIIQALIRIAIQKAIIGPLANMLFGEGEGLGGIVGGLFGKRASGGHVVGGSRYQVNEGGGIEGFQPAGSGKIIPLGRMNGADRGGGGTTIIQQFTLDARYGITSTELLRHVDRVAASRAAQAGQAAFQASQKQLPERFSKLQKLGR